MCGSDFGQAALFQFLGCEWLLGGLHAVGATIMRRICLEAASGAGRVFHCPRALLCSLLRSSAWHLGQAVVEAEVVQGRDGLFRVRERFLPCVLENLLALPVELAKLLKG